MNKMVHDDASLVSQVNETFKEAGIEPRSHEPNVIALFVAKHLIDAYMRRTNMVLTEEEAEQLILVVTQYPQITDDQVSFWIAGFRAKSLAKAQEVETKLEQIIARLPSLLTPNSEVKKFEAAQHILESLREGETEQVFEAPDEVEDKLKKMKIKGSLIKALLSITSEVIDFISLFCGVHAVSI